LKQAVVLLAIADGEAGTFHLLLKVGEGKLLPDPSLDEVKE